MGRTAEGRSELAELADESTSSANASIPLSLRTPRMGLVKGKTLFKVFRK